MAAIEIEVARESGAREELEGLGAKIAVEPDHFDGGPEILSAIVVLTPVIIPSLVSMVKARIAAKRHVKVKMKGIEITGASLKDIDRFLRSQRDKD